MPTALILGASGLVGSHLLQRLLDSSGYDPVVSLVRHPTGQVHPKLKEVPVMFGELSLFRNSIKADDVFCCLGTTMKAAGSRDAFRKVDYEYVVDAAGIALKNGATRFFLVSSVGAMADSVIFYSRVKGEVEQAISRMPYQSVSIFRPSFILGERTVKRGPAEAVASAFDVGSFMLVGPFRKYRPIHANTIATAIVAVAMREVPGTRIYESNEIEALGKEGAI